DQVVHVERVCLSRTMNTAASVCPPPARRQQTKRIEKVRKAVAIRAPWRHVDSGTIAGSRRIPHNRTRSATAVARFPSKGSDMHDPDDKLLLKAPNAPPVGPHPRRHAAMPSRFRRLGLFIASLTLLALGFACSGSGGGGGTGGGGIGNGNASDWDQLVWDVGTWK